MKEEASAAAEETPAAAEGGTDGANDTQEGDDDCPVWQNPLHHNDPKFEKVFTEGECALSAAGIYLVCCLRKLQVTCQPSSVNCTD